MRELGVVDPETVDGFVEKALPANEIEVLPKVIGSLKTAKAEKPILIEELEKATGKKYWKSEARSPEPVSMPKDSLSALKKEQVFLPTNSKMHSEIGYPPVGEQLGAFPAQIYYPLQRRFTDITLKAVSNEHGVVLFGASLCEEVQEGNVVLTPCIFRELFPIASESTQKSKLEFDLGETVRKGLDLEFYAWARYAVSYTGCTGGSYRTTFQFGEKAQDKYISLRVPFSSDGTDALSELDRRSEHPCQGIDLFLTPEAVVAILGKIDAERVGLQTSKSVPVQPAPGGWNFQRK